MNSMVLLRIPPDHEADLRRIPAGSDVFLTAGDVSVPVSFVTARVQTGGDKPGENVRSGITGPGFLLGDDIAEWTAVIIMEAGNLRIASSMLPDARTAELLRLGRDELEHLIP